MEKRLLALRIYYLHFPVLSLFLFLLMCILFSFFIFLFLVFFLFYFLWINVWDRICFSLDSKVLSTEDLLRDVFYDNKVMTLGTIINKRITIRFHKDNLRHHPRFPLIGLANNRFSLLQTFSFSFRNRSCPFRNRELVNR